MDSEELVGTPIYEIQVLVVVILVGSSPIVRTRKTKRSYERFVFV